MDREKMIDEWGKELARVRSQMDELGPIAVVTLQEVIRLLQGLIAALERRVEK